MDMIQSYEIKNTPATSYQISTTAISRTELQEIALPRGVVHSRTLTQRTRLLVTYKAVFTEKYVQALFWNIPIVSPHFLYSDGVSYKQFELKPFQGAVFSTSGITEEIYPNYFILLGARYEPNCTIFVDFLICDNDESEKAAFCKRYEIPIIRTSQVFKNDYRLFQKKTKYDAKQLGPRAMFFEQIFYLDPALPKELFNKLRRLIIKNEGTRVSTINDDTMHIITMNFENFKKHAGRIIHYQYIFDCCESNALLYPEFYQYSFSMAKPILPNVVAGVDRDMEHANEYVNKLKSLGAIVKGSVDLRCTHYFTRKHHEGTIKAVQYKIMSPVWIDQCLCLLRSAKEGRYTQRGPTLSLTRRIDQRNEQETVFQFTGLPVIFKEEAIRKFREHGIKFIDSERFEGCTHLIMGTLNLSEKFFCSLVSGSWILRPDFIEDFECQANFEYEKYEWTATENMSSKEQRSIGSVQRWRKHVQEGGKKAFHRWNVKIHCADEKLRNYQSLLTAGGAEMDPQKPFTHIFVDKGQHVQGERVLSIDSIFSYLFKPPTA